MTRYVREEQRRRRPRRPDDERVEAAEPAPVAYDAARARSNALDAHAAVRLQRAAGNTALAGTLQRDKARRPGAPHVGAVEGLGRRRRRVWPSRVRKPDAGGDG